MSNEHKIITLQTERRAIEVENNVIRRETSALYEILAELEEKAVQVGKQIRDNNRKINANTEKFIAKGAELRQLERTKI